MEAHTWATYNIFAKSVYSQTVLLSEVSQQSFDRPPATAILRRRRSSGPSPTDRELHSTAHHKAAIVCRQPLAMDPDNFYHSAAQYSGNRTSRTSVPPLTSLPHWISVVHRGETLSPASPQQRGNVSRLRCKLRLPLNQARSHWHRTGVAHLCTGSIRMILISRAQILLSISTE